MNRKDFLKKGFLGVGSIVALPTALSACKGKENPTNGEVGDCVTSPSETAGPFPIRTPADLVKANIISDREGIALLINLTVQDKNNACQPMASVLVDIWHCDAVGNYSEYDSFRNVSFLRGRQMTDANGQVSFISIYPGWYRGRAPHIHIEVLDSNENSLLVSQIAFPDSVSETVYSTSSYRGSADTSNSRDGLFRDSLDQNMADAVEGNTTEGYTLEKTIIVNG